MDGVPPADNSAVHHRAENPVPPYGVEQQPEYIKAHNGGRGGHEGIDR